LGSPRPWCCGKKRRTKRRETGEKVVKILAKGKILKLGEDLGDQPAGGRQMLGQPGSLASNAQDG